MIDADLLEDEVMYLFIQITGNPKQQTVVNECKSSFQNMIEEQPTVEAIPVVRGKFPETNADHIRNMTDVEIARFIGHAQADRVRTTIYGQKAELPFGESEWLKWLQSPVEVRE